MRSIVIVGSGAAGLTAAIYASRANLSPLVVSGVLPGGLLTQTSDVENYPGFSKPINGFELMTEFQKQAERCGAEIKNDVVKSVGVTPGGPHELELGGGEKIECAALIIATGASPRWLGLESEEKFKNKGVSACATCDGAFYQGMPVAVVGGGDTAMEEALFLSRFASSVTLVHRRNEFRASKVMADRVLKNPKIKVVWDSVAEELNGGAELESATVRNLKTGEKSEITCKGFFVALGHAPNTQIFKGQIDISAEGYIILRENSSRTNVEGVFAAGDCADHVYRQAITAAGMGCRAAIDAERWLGSKS